MKIEYSRTETFLPDNLYKEIANIPR